MVRYLASIQSQMEAHGGREGSLIGSFSVFLFLSLLSPHVLVGGMSFLRASWRQESELRRGIQIMLLQRHPLLVRKPPQRLASFPPISPLILPSVEEDFVSGGLVGSFCRGWQVS